MSSKTIQLEIGQHSIAGRKPRNDDSYGIVIPAAEQNPDRKETAP